MGIKIIFSLRSKNENTPFGTGKNKEVTGPYNKGAYSQITLIIFAIIFK